MSWKESARTGLQASVLSLATWHVCHQLGLSASRTRQLAVALPVTHLVIATLIEDIRKDPWVLPAKSWSKTVCFLGGGTLLLVLLHGAVIPLERLVQKLKGRLPQQNAVRYLEWAVRQGGAIRTKALLRICVLAPLAEEIVFRGFLQEDLERLSGFCTASLVVTSLAFGALHYSAQQGLANLPIVMATTIIGLHLGAAHNEGGLISAIGFHMAHNSLLTARMLAFRL